MDYKCSVPEGKSGAWEVKNYTVKNELQYQIRILRSGRGVPPGTYKKLTRDGCIIMSDTPDEIRDHHSIIKASNGNVLIAGLGLGIIVDIISKKENINSIVVIENSKDVINLVGHHITSLLKNRCSLTIINDDIFSYVPPSGLKYDCVWFDIWDDLCVDNLKEMEKLHRKYGRKSSWKGSWGKEYLKRIKKQEQRRWF